MSEHPMQTYEEVRVRGDLGDAMPNEVIKTIQEYVDSDVWSPEDAEDWIEQQNVIDKDWLRARLGGV